MAGRMGVRGATGPPATLLSPESAMASDLFDQFVSAGTFKAVLYTYRQICELLRMKPSSFQNFYPKLKAKLRSWKAASLWAKLDKRASHKCYNRGKACQNTRVLIIGAGPCGLRTAIEAQLLGCKVVVIEKRDRFSRNNVLHLWPFVIHDLRNLGGKKFFGKFCAGSIDHISIRQLQLILLKVALLLGVEVHENVSFDKVLDPPEDQTKERVGWRAAVTPADHPVAQYEFDVLVGSDGKRNTLLGFNRKEFRGKLAIAITANFINRQTMEEAQINEISGVAFIFNQKFFQDMKEQTGIDLENIVYYKDDTHYFVMTAKKQSLLEKGVIINDFSDTARLLSPDNVNREALMDYARDAADFATCYQMPHQDFAVNHYGQADVAMFDFTSMYAAENACRMVERRGHRLLQALVGDCLLEPFWPTGSGCARGFLSAFDAAWMIRSWASGKMAPLQVLAEREAIYRLLAQTTPENLSKDLNQYMLNPSSRYPNLNLNSVLPSQVRCLCDTDAEIQDQLPDVVPDIQRKKRRRMSLIHPDALLAWCQRQVSHIEGLSIDNLSTSWKNGLALCGILHRYRPDLVDLKSLKEEDSAKNNQLAFDICEREFGIPPVMTGLEMSQCDVPDKLAMVAYVTQIYDTFRGEIPYLVRPALSPTSDDQRPSGSVTPVEAAELTKGQGETKKLNLTRIRLPHRKRYSIEGESNAEGSKRIKTPAGLSNAGHRRRLREKNLALNLESKEVALTGFKKIPPSQASTDREQFRAKMKHLQKQLKKDEGQRVSDDSEMEPHEHLDTKPPRPQLIGKINAEDWNIKMLEEKLKNRGKVTDLKKTPSPKPSRFKKDEWNIKLLEEKLKLQQMPPPPKDVSEPRPKVLKEIFDSRLNNMASRLQAEGGLTEEEEAKFGQFDSTLQKLDQRLKEGTLEAGKKGCNRVAAMTQYMATKLDASLLPPGKVPSPPPPVLPSTETYYEQPAAAQSFGKGGSELCCFCLKRVYLMERLSAEGLFFHRSCFRCDYCGANLRLGNYACDRAVHDDHETIAKFYCPPHFRMQRSDKQMQLKHQRFAEMMKRKHAFLSGPLEGVTLPKKSPPATPITPITMETEVLQSTPKEIEPDITCQTPKTPTLIEGISGNEDQWDATNMAAHSSLFVISSDFIENRTPERVEFENSNVAMSEDELLTSELEEEELTQKNLGITHEIDTSDDSFSDLSTDSDSDQEAAYVEQLLSFTADGTRKLAETWQQRQCASNSRKNNQKSDKLTGKLSHVRFQGRVDDGTTDASKEFVCGDEGHSQGSSTPEAITEEDESQDEYDDDDDDDEDETETGGDDTSDDVLTDEEYNYMEAENVAIPEVAVTEEVVPKGVIDQREDVVMQVPILKPKEVTSDSEEYTVSESEECEELAIQSNESLDESTDTEEEQPQIAHSIPTIIIDESPPQPVVEQDWAEEMAAKTASETSLAEEIVEVEKADENKDAKEVRDTDKFDLEAARAAAWSFVDDVVSTARNSLSNMDDDITAVSDKSNENKSKTEESIAEVQGETVTPLITEKLERIKTITVESSQPQFDVFKSSKLKSLPKLTIDNKFGSDNKLVMEDQKTVKQSTECAAVPPILSPNTASYSSSPLLMESQFSFKDTGSQLPATPPNSATILQASRLSMDKFRFIAGSGTQSPSSPVYSSPHKSSATPKELASKLNEFRRKIEELQKQLPSPDQSVSAAKPIQPKTRGEMTPFDHQCSDYYASMQSKKEENGALLKEASSSPLVVKNIEKLDSIPVSVNDTNDKALESKVPTTNEKELVSAEIKAPLLPLVPDRKEIIDEPDKSDLNQTTYEKDIIISEKPVKTVPNLDLELPLKTPPTPLISSSPESTPSTTENTISSPEKFTDHILPLVTPDSEREISFDIDKNARKDIIDPRESELNQLAEKYNFNPSFITLRRKKAEKEELPYSKFHNELVIDSKYQTTPPRSKVIPSSSTPPIVATQKPFFPLQKSCSVATSTGISKSLFPSTDMYKRVSFSPQKINFDLSSSSSAPSSETRFQGYRGSFADKIRPRSLVGDTIYLKSIDINLQKQAFPSLSKQQNFGGSCGRLKESVRSSSEEPHSDIKISKFASGIGSRSTDNILLGSREDENESIPTRDVKNSSPRVILTLTRQPSIPKSTPIAIQSDKSGAKSSNSQGKIRVQEKMKKVPFADDEIKSLASESAFGSTEDVFITPGAEGISKNEKTFYDTPPETMNNNMRKNYTSALNKLELDQPLTLEEEKALRIQRTVDQEKARQEARERARMKSDEELGLSPCNYRKRYQTSSLSLGNYDELSSEDFLDDDNEDMYDDDSIHESNDNLVARKLNFNTSSKDLDKSGEGGLETTNICITSPLSGGELDQATSSLTDSKNYLESSISPDDIEVAIEGSGIKNSLMRKTVPITTKPRNVLSSSTESSPEGLDSRITSIVKTKGKIKFRLDKKPSESEGSLEPEEKRTSSGGKKSLFSLLSFGRNGNSPKDKKGAKSRSSSLPPPESRTKPKERTFPLLKFSKVKERTSREKQKKYMASQSEEQKDEKIPTTGRSSPVIKIEVKPKSASEPPEIRPSITPSPAPTSQSIPLTPVTPLTPVAPLTSTTHLENGLAPKASVDSYTDTEEESSRALGVSLALAADAKKEKVERDKRVLKMAQRLHHQQELKRFRTAQEIHRRLQEIEVSRKDLEKKGVTLEKTLRRESGGQSEGNEDFDLMQEWFSLVRNRNKLEREEQELTIRMKDLELEERHSHLQQEMRERMAIDDSIKTKADIEKERDILSEMLRIVEKRDELVYSLDQLRIGEEVEEKNLESKMAAQGLSPSVKS